MFPSLRNIRRPDVHYGAADTLRRRDNDIVVFSDLKCVQRFMHMWLVEDTRIDGIGNGVVDEFTEDETVPAFVEYLHSFCRYGKSRANIWVIF